jgi:hypothetical protein
MGRAKDKRSVVGVEGQQCRLAGDEEQWCRLVGDEGQQRRRHCSPADEERGVAGGNEGASPPEEESGVVAAQRGGEVADREVAARPEDEVAAADAQSKTKKQAAEWPHNEGAR